MSRICKYITLSILVSFGSLSAKKPKQVKLISDKMIAKQKQLTETVFLKNGIPVVYRHIKGSEIFNLKVSFNRGSKDLNYATRPALNWMFATMTLASLSKDRKQVSKIIEKYAIGLNCVGGIDTSSCNLETVNKYLDKSFDLFIDLIKKPKFLKKDAEFMRDRLLLSLKETPAEPGSFINDLVNTIYYDESHPYGGYYLDNISNLAKMKLEVIKEEHKKLLNANRIKIVVATSLSLKAITKKLNSAFSSIKKKKHYEVKVKQPKFDIKNSYVFENRKIPTAYMRMKFKTHGAKHKDALKTKLMFNILSKKLSIEVREKRQLSYSVYSYSTPLSIGIGVIGVSTAKPKDTLPIITAVINDLKANKISESDLEEYKRIFYTHYFMSLESHGSLVAALTNYFIDFKNVTKFYSLPTELDKITPDDIIRLAKELLVNMKVAVIFERSKFKDKWAKDFIKQHLLAI